MKTLPYVLIIALTFLGNATNARAADTDTNTKTSRPDILIIMPDQMRGDCLSALKHPVLRTPQLDGLARQGVLFRRAYTPVPSCIPARYALLTGLSPSDSGVVGYGAKKITTPTMPGTLAEAGYSTVLVGRNMHQLESSGSCGYQKRILGSTYLSNDAYDNFLRQAAPDSGGIRNIIGKLKIDCNGWRGEPWPLERELHPTAWVVSESRKTVADTPKDQPLFLTSSFYAPHPPLFPPKKEFDYYYNHKSLPKAARGDWAGEIAPQVAKQRGAAHHVRLEGDVLRNAQAGYFGLIENLDTEIGPLVRDFKARSESAGRPWVIVVTSDHGEMLGDHDLFRKCEPLEGSSNIPMIIVGSKELGFKAGSRSHQPVCLEDIMPTLLTLAGLPVPPVLSGVSLVPSLRGEDQTIREVLHFEHSTCYSKQQAFHALTDGRFKYIWRPDDGLELLFDLDADPRELHDLARVPSQAATLQKWRDRLIARLADRPEGFVQDGKLVSGRPYARLNSCTPKLGGTNEHKNGS